MTCYNRLWVAFWNCIQQYCKAAYMGGCAIISPPCLAPNIPSLILTSCSSQWNPLMAFLWTKFLLAHFYSMWVILIMFPCLRRVIFTFAGLFDTSRSTHTGLWVSCRWVLSCYCSTQCAPRIVEDTSSCSSAPLFFLYFTLPHSFRRRSLHILSIFFSSLTLHFFLFLVFLSA